MEVSSEFFLFYLLLPSVFPPEEMRDNERYVDKQVERGKEMTEERERTQYKGGRKR